MLNKDDVMHLDLLINSDKMHPFLDNMNVQ